MIILKPHQLSAVSWLQSKNWRGLVYADVGTGKTFIALEAARQSGSKNVLIIAPKSLIPQWWEEISVFFEGKKAGLLISIVNYEKFLNDDFIKKLTVLIKWDMIIADECEKLKSPVSKIVKRFMKFSQVQNVPYRLALSGTPAPNFLHELWSITNWFSSGILESNFFSFRKIHCYTNPFIPSQIVGYRNKEYLLSVFKQHYFRITDEVLNLPDAEREIIWLELSKEERLLYKTIHDEACVRLGDGGMLTIPNLLVEITRLAQFVNVPEVFGMEARNTKLKALEHVLSDLRGKAIIFSEFASACKRLHARFGGALLVGELSQKRRQEEIERFKNDPECRYLWASSAGSLGLNLQCAENVVNFSLPFSNARLRQRLGRSRRLGQMKNVKEIFLIAKETVEEHIWKIIERKKNLELTLSRKDYKEILEI